MNERIIWKPRIVAGLLVEFGYNVRGEMVCKAVQNEEGFTLFKYTGKSYPIRRGTYNTMSEAKNSYYTS